MNKKKPYKAPEVTKVKLSIGNSILSVCHTSPTVMSPIGEMGGCNMTPGCQFGPGN